MEIKEAIKVTTEKNNSHVKWAVVRTVLNAIIIISDTLPIFAIPGSIIETLNILAVLANRVGIKIPNLTPNVNNGILGAGIIGEIFDTVTLELLPFPSSIFIQGSQILHDIRPIHEHAMENPKLTRIRPITGFVYNVSLKLLKSS